MGIVIGRPINGIALNGNEYLMLADNSDYMQFESKEHAVELIREEMFPEATEEEIDEYFVFVDYDELVREEQACH